MKLPKHINFTLTHNGQNSSYETVAEYLDHLQAGVEYFVNLEQMLKALDNNDLWEAQWYPDTPIGFYRLFAYDLDVLLEALANHEDS